MACERCGKVSGKDETVHVDFPAPNLANNDYKIESVDLCLGCGRDWTDVVNRPLNIFLKRLCDEDSTVSKT